MERLAAGFCYSLSKYKRLKTEVAHVGDVPLGGAHPIRVQSMATANTLDTKNTVEESIRMIKAGSEYIRITTPSIKEAENLKNIKQELKKRGYHTPLVADVHFTPNAAEVAARIVEKVRVNPGNYADKKRFQFIEYTDQSYKEEIERIADRFSPLVRICKEYGTAMRIGVNHGSLSDRIMSRYGDTPRGMVESAMEFIQVCEDMNYHNLVISMKSSNPQVMVQAYRLLIQTMSQRSLIYPIHLGVTEAGDGEDGRIKSAIGIGTLLEDGIGDTIRVSLTEAPENEVPVAKTLADRYRDRKHEGVYSFTEKYRINPFEYSKRETTNVVHVGGDNVPRVILDYTETTLKDPQSIHQHGYHYSAWLDKFNMDDTAADCIFWGSQVPAFTLPGNLKSIFYIGTWNILQNKKNSHPLFNTRQWLGRSNQCDSLNFIAVSHEDMENDDFLESIKHQCHCVLIFSIETPFPYSVYRQMFFKLMAHNINIPVILRNKYTGLTTEKLTLFSSIDVGGILIEGLANGIWLQSDKVETKHIRQLAFNILQASRTRISKTEYISCPSCGRTLFDLQETTQVIREQTEHLKGVKIGIMGCIVNGPGEMADADYGYVGTGPDKITLYRGQEVVRKNIKTENAVNELIELIKEDGSWIEKT